MQFPLKMLATVMRFGMDVINFQQAAGFEKQLLNKNLTAFSKKVKK